MKLRSSLSLVCAAVLAVAAGTAYADSTYGYNPAGGGTVTATASVKLSVYVPKVVVLRVGSPGTTVDTLSYATRYRISTPGTNIDGSSSTTSVDSAAISWNGVAPVVSVPTNTKTTQAYFWTNGSNVTLKCQATGFTGSGPALTDVTAAAGSGDTLPHPDTTSGIGVCGQTSALQSGSVLTGTWTYTLDTANAATWAPGEYTATVTYTAAGT